MTTTIRGRAVNITIELTPPLPWEDLDSLKVDLVTGMGEVPLVADLNYDVTGTVLTIQLTATDTDQDIGVYGFEILAEWPTLTETYYVYPAISIIEQNSLGISSYATPEEAYNYALSRQPITETYTDLQRYLIQASDMMDALRYTGTLVEGQARIFPRVEDDDIIPSAIKAACIENALALIDGVDVALEFENLNMTNQAYANVRTAHDRTVKPDHIVAGIPSLTAWRLMLPYLPDPREIGFNSIRS